MLHKVFNLDTGKGLYFQARTPYEAMVKLRYWLSCKDGAAKNLPINITRSNLHLYLVYRDETWCIRT